MTTTLTTPCLYQVQIPNWGLNQFKCIQTEEEYVAWQKTQPTGTDIFQMVLVLLACIVAAVSLFGWALTKY